MAGLELVGGVEHVLNLSTGEMLVLADASLDDLAEARLALTDLHYARQRAAALIDDELIRRADEATLAGDDFGRSARFRVYPARSTVRQYHSNPMRGDLLRRVDRGEFPGIAPGAIEGLFAVAEYRLDLKRWRDLEKNPTLPPESRQRLTEIVEAHSDLKRRGVKIERRAVVEGTATDESEAAA